MPSGCAHWLCPLAVPCLCAHWRCSLAVQAHHLGDPWSGDHRGGMVHGLARVHHPKPRAAGQTISSTPRPCLPSRVPNLLECLPVPADRPAANRRGEAATEDGGAGCRHKWRGAAARTACRGVGGGRRRRSRLLLVAKCRKPVPFVLSDMQPHSCTMQRGHQISYTRAASHSLHHLVD